MATLIVLLFGAVMKKTALALIIMFALLVLLVVGVPFTIMFAQAQTSSPEPAVLDHFSFDYISDGQTVGVPFKITITAMDQYNHTFTSYNGTNTLDATEINFHIVDISKWYHVSLGVTGTFVNGVWSGQITIPEAFYYWEISTSGGGKSGASNWFTVYNPPTTPSPNPTTLPSPTSSIFLTPTPTVPEFPALELLPLLIVLLSSAVILRRRKQVKKS
jgi:hypothetical protein